jgi:hypothetical protein
MQGSSGAKMWIGCCQQTLKILTTAMCGKRARGTWQTDKTVVYHAKTMLFLSHVSVCPSPHVTNAFFMAKVSNLEPGIRQMCSSLANDSTTWTTGAVFVRN